MWGDAGAPLRPGLSGAIKGPAPPARDWPHHPVLSSTPRHLPLPRGAAGFSPATGHNGAGARGGAGAGPVSAMGASLGLCPGPGPVPIRGGPHPPGLVRVGARCPLPPWCRGLCCVPALCPARTLLPAGPSLPSPPLCFADPAACSCRLPRLVARFQPHSAYQSSSLHPTARVYPLALPCPCLPRSPQHVKA